MLPKLVLCETFKYDMTTTETNKRKECNEIMERARDQHPWFGIEQEYTILEQGRNSIQIILKIPLEKDSCKSY